MGNRFGRSVRRSALALMVAAGLVGVTGAAQATLMGRDLDGIPATFEAYYDDVLHITWLKDANYAKTSGFDADGAMMWASAKSWATSLVFDGLSGWRLPTLSSISPTPALYNCNPGAGGIAAACAASGNELGYMFYYNLGGVSGSTIGTTHNANYNDFVNIQNDYYWSGTELDSTGVWLFGFGNGAQSTVFKTGPSFYFGWAVHPGDVVAAAPEPASLLLMGLGLAGLGFSRRKKA